MVCGRGKGPCASVPSRTRSLSHRRAAERSPFTSALYAWWYAAAWSGPGAAGGDDATERHAHPARTQKRRNRWVGRLKPAVPHGRLAGRHTRSGGGAAGRTCSTGVECGWKLRRWCGKGGLRFGVLCACAAACVSACGRPVRARVSVRTIVYEALLMGFARFVWAFHASISPQRAHTRASGVCVLARACACTRRVVLMSHRYLPHPAELAALKLALSFCALRVGNNQP